MIVVPQAYGQLGNQLFRLAHLLAFAHRENTSVFAPSFCKYLSGFKFATDADPLRFARQHGVRLHLGGPRGSKLFQKYFHSRSKAVCLLQRLGAAVFNLDPLTERCLFEVDSPEVSPMKARVCFFYGWQFRGLESLSTIGPILKELFAPSAVVQSINHDLFAGHTGPTVGIHVRRGDYRQYCPEQVFEDDYVEQLVERLRFLMPDAKIMIVSDETHFDNPNLAALHRKGDLFTDLDALGRCKYIAGPLSTFSRWAAFLHRRPHYTFDKHRLPESMSEFSLFKACQPACSVSSLSPDELEKLFFFGVV